MAVYVLFWNLKKDSPPAFWAVGLHSGSFYIFLLNVYRFEQCLLAKINVLLYITRSSIFLKFHRRYNTMAFVIGDGCVSCGSCAGQCPVGAISEGDGKYVIDESSCVSCGSCAGQCPVGAISEG